MPYLLRATCPMPYLAGFDRPSPLRPRWSLHAEEAIGSPTGWDLTGVLRTCLPLERAKTIIDCVGRIVWSANVSLARPTTGMRLVVLAPYLGLWSGSDDGRVPYWASRPADATVFDDRRLAKAALDRVLNDDLRCGLDLLCVIVHPVDAAQELLSWNVGHGG